MQFGPSVASRKPTEIYFDPALQFIPEKQGRTHVSSRLATHNRLSTHKGSREDRPTLSGMALATGSRVIVDLRNQRLGSVYLIVFSVIMKSTALALSVFTVAKGML
ncbi:hypothetical protein Enr10x_10720 [Gimesia panareensis]|uniref:Uncharacterized protein n=1 Tax=Gimesia panareensis TaxID=2527978 RepID=A0A517Q2B0_9PLAN|nr:hypothetical protein Enr10x_10720 [Gimesia panareensis]QDU48713.1 hypothetical protein Pan110_10280 [Gimesia panareensis]